MVVAYSLKVLDSYAPGLSRFSSAAIPPLDADFAEAPHWVGNYLLNSIYDGSFPPRAHVLVMAFIRRAHLAFRDFHDARSLTMRYLAARAAATPQSVVIYYDAIARWEGFVLQTAMAIDLFNSLGFPEKAFKKNDRSKEQRLYTMANQIKHTASCISDGRAAVSELIPLWLDNRGFVSFEIELSYSEAGDVLRDVATLADALQNPRGFVEAHRSARERSAPPAR